MTDLNRRDMLKATAAAMLIPALGPVAAQAQGANAVSITPFKIAISDEQIADLKQRLAQTRWPVAATETWSHGQPVHFIKELAAQWADKYDWRAHEAALNQYPQFTTQIDGQNIHFLHIRSPEPNAFPLILTHGWPSSIAEFTKVIGPLSDPRAHGLDPKLAFDLVIPSLPGYGFSGPLTETGWDTAHVAKAWATLMERLGYAEYGAQGGDVGALVTKELGILAPEGLKGIHLQQIFAFPNGTPGEMETLTPFEAEGAANFENFAKYSGYADIQSKRPGTLAYGLVDSPVAQMAWNTELFFGFEGEGAEVVDRDAFLTHASIYWFTATGGSAASIYFEDGQSGSGYREVQNNTPTGVAVFPWDFRSIRSFAERSNNIVHWSEMASGGHFAASDAPDLLVGDMRAFFAKVR